MISWLCGRMSAGKGRRWRAGSGSQPELICGVSELAERVATAAGSRGERPVALLVELARVLDGLGLAAQRPGIAQELDDRLAGSHDRFAGEVAVGVVRGCGVAALPARAAEGHRD